MDTNGILTNGDPQQVMLRLRERLMDMERSGVLKPEAASMYKMSMLQIWQECERRRQECLGQAQQLREQAKAAEAQSHAFSIMSSIVYSVVNGYMTLEEKRVHEEAQRRAEAEAADQPVVPEKSPKKRRKNGEAGNKPSEDLGAEVGSKGAPHQS